jgi:hypothetical protein
MLFGKTCTIRSKIPDYMMAGMAPESAKPVFSNFEDIIPEAEDREYLNRIMSETSDRKANQYDILDFFGKP